MAKSMARARAASANLSLMDEEPVVTIPPVVDPSWVADHLGDCCVLDVRWYLDGSPGHDAYLAGHVPGARWVDLDRVLADPPGARGRHPLPPPGRFAAHMAALGVSSARPVVAYDSSGNMAAARAVWMLRVLGHPAALMDGALAAWPGPLEHDEPVIEPGDFSTTLVEWPRSVLVDAEGLGRVALVLDARAPERYRGEVEPIDPRAGHVPGAKNLHWADNLGPDGRFLPPEVLRSRFGALGLGASAGDVAVYCGSGVSACHELLALEHAGLGRGRLYPGSWSEWSSDPARPVATGDDQC